MTGHHVKILGYAQYFDVVEGYFRTSEPHLLHGSLEQN